MYFAGQSTAGGRRQKGAHVMRYQIFKRGPKWERPPRPARLVGVIEADPDRLPIRQERVLFVDGDRGGATPFLLVR